MIIRDAGIRWAANAPSAALLAAALRDEVPPTRFEPLQTAPALQFFGEQDAASSTWRVWPLDGPPVLFKRHGTMAAYHSELCNLRFFNATARLHTPRLLACDDAALALLIEDVGGHALPAVEEVVGPLPARRAWERTLSAIAAVHVYAVRQPALLRRLYAPQWPPVVPLPSPDLLERAMDAALASRHGQPPTVSERGVLIAADSWLQHRLASAAQHRVPILGIASPYAISMRADRIIFTDLTRPPLGLPAMDLLCTWQRDDRRDLLEQVYLPERARLGAPLPPAQFWEIDAACLVAGCAQQLCTLNTAGAPSNEMTAHLLRIGSILHASAQGISPLEQASRLIVKTLEY